MNKNKNKKRKEKEKREQSYLNNIIIKTGENNRFEIKFPLFEMLYKR